MTTKPVHLAKMIREDGAVSPFCAEKPRALNLRVSSWTNRKEAATCKKCLANVAVERVRYSLANMNPYKYAELYQIPATSVEEQRELKEKG